MSFILVALATGFMIPVIIEYIQTGLVPRFPTLIVCGFAVIAAIQSFFTGQLLKTIYQKNRQDFEMNLYSVTSEMNEKLEK